MLVMVYVAELLSIIFHPFIYWMGLRPEHQIDIRRLQWTERMDFNWRECYYHTARKRINNVDKNDKVIGKKEIMN